MRKLICILLILNQTHLNAQVYTPDSDGVFFEIKDGKTSFVGVSAQHNGRNLDLITDKQEFINKAKLAVSTFYTVKETREALGLIIDRAARFDISQNSINEVLQNIDRSLLKDAEVKIVYDNLENYKKIFNSLSLCKDNDLKLCEGTLSYLSSLDITKIATPYKKNEVYSSLINKTSNFINDLNQDNSVTRENLGSVKDELFKNTIINIVKTILELEYRFKEFNLYNDLKISNLYDSICSKSNNEDFCSSKYLDIKIELNNFINKYTRNLTKAGVERFTYLEAEGVINKKISNMNEYLEKVAVPFEICIEFNKFKQKYVYSIDPAYANRNFIPTYYKDKPSNNNLAFYKAYTDEYFSLIKDPLGIVFLSDLMQEDGLKHSSDQGLRTLKGASLFERMGNDLGRIVKLDFRNAGRENSLACSRQHKFTNSVQIKNSLIDLIKDLISFATYLRDDIYFSEREAYLKSMYVLKGNTYEMANLLKNNPEFSFDITKIVQIINTLDTIEKYAINITRILGALSILALGAGAVVSWAGVPTLAAYIKAGSAAAGLLSAVGEYGDVYYQSFQELNATYRMSLKVDLTKYLINPEIYQDKKAYLDTFFKNQKEDNINRSMLALELLGVIGDAPDLIKYLKSAKRLENLAKSLDLRYTKIQLAIFKASNSKRASSNILNALASRKYDEITLIFSKLMNMNESELIKFIDDNNGWSSNKFRNYFESWIEADKLKSTNKVKYINKFDEIDKDEIIKNVKSVDTYEAKKYFQDLLEADKAVLNEFKSLTDRVLENNDYQWLYYIHMSGNVFDVNEMKRIKVNIMNIYKKMYLKDVDIKQFSDWREKLFIYNILGAKRTQQENIRNAKNFLLKLDVLIKEQEKSKLPLERLKMEKNIRTKEIIATYISNILEDNPGSLNVNYSIINPKVIEYLFMVEKGTPEFKQIEKELNDIYQMIIKFVHDEQIFSETKNKLTKLNIINNEIQILLHAFSGNEELLEKLLNSKVIDASLLLKKIIYNKSNIDDIVIVIDNFFGNDLEKFSFFILDKTHIKIDKLLLFFNTDNKIKFLKNLLKYIEADNVHSIKNQILFLMDKIRFEEINEDMFLKLSDILEKNNFKIEVFQKIFNDTEIMIFLNKIVYNNKLAENFIALTNFMDNDQIKNLFKTLEVLNLLNIIGINKELEILNSLTDINKYIEGSVANFHINTKLNYSVLSYLFDKHFINKKDLKIVVNNKTYKIDLSTEERLIELKNSLTKGAIIPYLDGNKITKISEEISEEAKILSIIKKQIQNANIENEEVLILYSKYVERMFKNKSREERFRFIEDNSNFTKFKEDVIYFYNTTKLKQLNKSETKLLHIFLEIQDLSELKLDNHTYELAINLFGFKDANFTNLVKTYLIDKYANHSSSTIRSYIKRITDTYSISNKASLTSLENELGEIKSFIDTIEAFNFNKYVNKNDLLDYFFYTLSNNYFPKNTYFAINKDDEAKILNLFEDHFPNQSNILMNSNYKFPALEAMLLDNNLLNVAINYKNSIVKNIQYLISKAETLSTKEYRDIINNLLIDGFDISNMIVLNKLFEDIIPNFNIKYYKVSDEFLAVINDSDLNKSDILYIYNELIELQKKFILGDNRQIMRDILSDSEDRFVLKFKNKITNKKYNLYHHRLSQANTKRIFYTVSFDTNGNIDEIIIIKYYEHEKKNKTFKYPDILGSQMAVIVNSIISSK